MDLTRKYIQRLINEVLEEGSIHEARRDSKKVWFSEQLIDDQIDRVTATFIGRGGSHATKLAKRYDELAREARRLNKERRAVSKQIREYAEDIFDAEDIVATRVMKTTSLTLQLDKGAQRERFDKDAFFAELAEMVPELTEQVQELREKHTEIKRSASRIRVSEKKINEKRNALTEDKLNEFTGMISAAWEKVKDMASRFYNTIRSWAMGYDRKLDSIAREAGVRL